MVPTSFLNNVEHYFQGQNMKHSDAWTGRSGWYPRDCVVGSHNQRHQSHLVMSNPVKLTPNSGRLSFKLSHTVNILKAFFLTLTLLNGKLRSPHKHNFNVFKYRTMVFLHTFSAY